MLYYLQLFHHIVYSDKFLHIQSSWDRLDALCSQFHKILITLLEKRKILWGCKLDTGTKK